MINKKKNENIIKCIIETIEDYKSIKGNKSDATWDRNDCIECIITDALRLDCQGYKILPKDLRGDWSE